MSAAGRSLDAQAEEWVHALDLAVQPGGPLRLAFQPIVDLERGTVAGYEVLARFALDGHPHAPLPWLDAAAHAGRLCDLEQAILARALAARPRLPPDTFLSVNLGAAALLDVGTSRLLAAAGDLRGLVVEITEHERVGDYDALRTALAPTLEAGALLAVDDAGSGYATLGHVLALRPAFVKLDRSLVADLDHERHRSAAVAAIGALTGELDGWLVAEGIERAGELAALTALGVPLGQGYLLGRPTVEELGRPPDELAVRLRASAGRREVRRTVGGLVAPVRTRLGTPPATRAASARAHDGVDDPRAADAEPEIVVVIDEHGAPLALEGLAIAGATERPMRVMPEEGLVEVAQRAAGRAPSERLLPLVCCDERGRAVGLLGVDRLLEALARSSAREDA